MKHINILKLTFSTVFLLGVNSAVAQLPITQIAGQSYDSIVQDTNWQTQILSFSGPESLLHGIYSNPGPNNPDGPYDLAPGALLYASDELGEAIYSVDFFSMENTTVYTPEDRIDQADLTDIDVYSIGTQSPEGSPAAEIVTIEAPTMVNNILASEALSTNVTVSSIMLVGEALIGGLSAAQLETVSLTLVNTDPEGSDFELDASGMGGLITREDDGLIHLGSNSFLFDDTSTDHVLTTNSGTEIILGGDIASTTGDDESKNIRVANDLNVDGDIFIDGNLGVQAQLNILKQSSSANAIANNSTAIASNKRSIEQNARGIAMVAALQHTTVLPGMNQALDVSAAHFEGETGMSINYARRINENVQINFGAASTDDFDESVIKAGIGFQW